MSKLLVTHAETQAHPTGVQVSDWCIGLAIAALPKVGGCVTETVSLILRLMLSWVALESHSHGVLHNLRKRAKLQAHSKIGNMQIET